MDTAEQWKPVVVFDGPYEVSNMGRARNISTGRILKQSNRGGGYPSVGLYLDGNRTHFKISHLVADAFLPAKTLTDTVVRHLNDDKSDNRACNLARGTHHDNHMDAVRNGKTLKGGMNPKAKLTEDDVREIRRLHATGKFLLRELALQFSVIFQTISLIVLRKTWKDVF